MNYPIPTIRACAATAIPGCHFAHGEKEEANIDLDRVSAAKPVVFVEDKMLVTPAYNKFKVRTTSTFGAYISVYHYSLLTDSSDIRAERMALILNAAYALLSALEQSAELVSVVAKNIVTVYNQFDANLDGVVMQLDITPAERASLCYP